MCLHHLVSLPAFVKKAKELEYIHTKQTQRVVDSKLGFLLVLSTNHYCSYASDTPEWCRVAGRSIRWVRVDGWGPGV